MKIYKLEGIKTIQKKNGSGEFTLAYLSCPTSDEVTGVETSVCFVSDFVRDINDYLRQVVVCRIHYGKVQSLEGIRFATKEECQEYNDALENLDEEFS